MDTLLAEENLRGRPVRPDPELKHQVVGCPTADANVPVVVKQLEVVGVTQEREVPGVVGAAPRSISKVVSRPASVRAPRRQALKSIPDGDRVAELDLVKPQWQVGQQKCQRCLVENLLVGDPRASTGGA
jgi:hypothetical protein